MWVAILFRKKEIDLLSLMSFGIEFQSFAPSYMKLFFILLVTLPTRVDRESNWGLFRVTDKALHFDPLNLILLSWHEASRLVKVCGNRLQC